MAVVVLVVVLIVRVVVVIISSSSSSSSSSRRRRSMSFAQTHTWVFYFESVKDTMQVSFDFTDFVFDGFWMGYK